MKEENKCNEIREFLQDSILIKALKDAYKKKDYKAVNIIESTIKEMYLITSSKGLVRYYNNIIRCDTPKLKYVSKYLKNKKIVRLEEVEKEFKKKFNNRWLNK